MVARNKTNVRHSSDADNLYLWACAEPEGDQTGDQKRTISINVNNVRAAAEFDVAHNPKTKELLIGVDEVESEIMECVRDAHHGVKSGKYGWVARSIVRRSFRVIFQPEDDYHGIISILVDPSVTMRCYYDSIEDFLRQS